MQPTLKTSVGFALIAVAVVAAIAVRNHQRGKDEFDARVESLAAGDIDRGRDAIARYGCGGCHQIPGVPGARSNVGPPLSAWSQRAYIAGRKRNTPENLIEWIVDPQHVEPGTAMPNVGVTPADAHDIAAYLYSLQ